MRLLSFVERIIKGYDIDHYCDGCYHSTKQKRYIINNLKYSSPHILSYRCMHCGDIRYYEVLEGLQPGEKVIVSNYDNFGNMDKLILKNSE